MQIIFRKDKQPQVFMSMEERKRLKSVLERDDVSIVVHESKLIIKNKLDKK